MENQKMLEMILAKLESMESKIDTMENKIETIENKIDAIQEDTRITREAVNSLIEWADKVAIIAYLSP